MENIDQTSDQLLHDIMHMEHEIEKIMALNGNRENMAVKKYRNKILIVKIKLKKLNGGYRGFL